MPADRPSRSVWWSRAGWLVLLWVAGVAAVTAFAWLLKLAMRAVGLTV